MSTAPEVTDAPPKASEPVNSLLQGAPRPRSRRVLVAAALPVAVMLMPLVLVAVCFWPGHMSADTLAQIDALRSGDYTNQHAPLLMALWKPLYSIGMGPGWLLVGQLIVFAAGCFLVLRAALRPLAAALVTAGLCLSPPVFGMLGYLSRDIWFTAFLMVTFGATIAASRAAPPRRRRLFGVAIAAAWLTLAARQNAAPAVIVGLVLVATLLLDRWNPSRPLFRRMRATGPRRLASAIVAGTLLTVLLMASQFGANAALGVRNVHPEQYLFIYDLAALSERERTNLFPPDVMPARGMRPIDTHWDPEVVNPLVFAPDAPVRTPLAPSRVRSLRSAWTDALGDHPFEYLDVRVDLWLRQIGIGRPAVWIYHPVIDANPFGYRVRFRDWNAAARDYVEGFAHDNLDGRSYMYPLWLYLLVSVVAGGFLIRRGTSRAAMIVGGLGVAALTFQVGIFFGAMGLGYRLEFSVVVTAILVSAVLIAELRSRRATGLPR